MNIWKFLPLVALMPFSFSCNSTNNNAASEATKNNNTAAPQTRVQHFDMQVINENPESVGKCGDRFSVIISGDGAVQRRQTRLTLDGQEIATLAEGDSTYIVDTKDLRCGVLVISAQVDFDGGPEYVSKSICLYSDVVPASKSYKVIKTYNHDRNAYTQGLLFDDGVFYESTGLNGKSSLRKVAIEKGSVLQSLSLDQQYFGEGLAMIGDRLFQLTWRSHKGFVYDKNTFEMLGEFNLGTEGWGLTAMNKDTLLLTDGTENLYFMDPNSLGVIKKMQVYDNVGPVLYLNETEMYNGHLLANIYHSDNVAEIDINTGKVLSYIDFSNLLPAELYAEDTDVLNGIAYDAKGDKLYVTGKNWPNLFLIKIIDTK